MARRAWRGALLLAMVAALAACGGPSSGAANAGSTTTTTTRPGSGATTTTCLSCIDPGHLVPAKPGPTTMPTEDAITPIHSVFNTGQQIAITPSGFEPKELGSTAGQGVVWSNVSGVTQQVIIPSIGVRSQPIPPGAQFVWTPKTGGVIGYTSASGFKAQLDVQGP
jgi:hypothetical protein